MPEYSKILESLAETCKPKMLAFLERIKTLLETDGYVVTGPHDMCDDMYAWSLTVRKFAGDDDKNLIDISLEIAEEREYDNPEGWGINFGLDITEYGGRILGGLSPYNYTPQVWVDSRDPLAVAARWRIIEDSDIGQIPDLMED